MWGFLVRQSSDRKMRLWMVACCRRIWDRLSDGPIRNAIEVAERYADGFAVEQEREAAFQAVMEWDAACRGVEPNADDLVYDHTACLALNAVSAPGQQDLFHFPAFINSIMDPSYCPATAAQRINEMAIQAYLVREFFGNPFRPVTLDSSWLIPMVTNLAHTIYDDQAFDRLPILADALEQSGCPSQDILSHLRGPGPHTRGCWALDLILGKK
jgi:hypothetical protein